MTEPKKIPTLVVEPDPPPPVRSYNGGLVVVIAVLLAAVTYLGVNRWVDSHRQDDRRRHACHEIAAYHQELRDQRVELLLVVYRGRPNEELRWDHPALLELLSMCSGVELGR